MPKNNKTRKAPITPAQIKRTLGLPPSARFEGYVVHIQKSDEFLMSTIQMDDYASWKWIRATPAKALRFRSYEAAASQVAFHSKGSIVAYLFDIGPRYAVYIPTRASAR